jgi:hypothetical protein
LKNCKKKLLNFHFTNKYILNMLQNTLSTIILVIVIKKNTMGNKITNTTNPLFMNLSVKKKFKRKLELNINLILTWTTLRNNILVKQLKI